MKKVIVGIPVYITCEQHKIFTEQTINSCKGYDVMAFDNKGLELAPLLESEYTIGVNEDLSVSAVWNVLIKEGLQQAEYVLIINNDIIFHPKAIENLVKFADIHPEYVMWTAAEWENLRTINDIPKDELDPGRFDEHPHFSAFMVNKKTIDKVGWFDENFHAYVEDMDYHRRIMMLGHKAGKTASARFYHYGSRTIACDDELRRKNAITQQQCNLYFQKKHGYNPDGKVAAIGEGFEYPFNDSTRSWKE